GGLCGGRRAAQRGREARRPQLRRLARGGLGHTGGRAGHARAGNRWRRRVGLRATSAATIRGGLCVAWPKRSPGLATDLTEDVFREIAVANGLVDNNVCAIAETWSGL